MAVEDMLTDIRFEQMQQASAIQQAVNSNTHDTINSAGNNTDTVIAQLTAHQQNIADRLYSIGRESADNRAQITALGYQVRDGFVAAAKDAEINALKTQVELAKQSTYLSDKIDAGNQRTQDLISKLNDDSLNRQLVERNTELVGALEGGRYWWGRHGDSQFAAISSQLQAFQSQLQETRQGMVNFGYMRGVDQTSTSNNVR